MRLFIAVKISDELQHLLERFISDAKKSLQFQKGIKWVKPENFHLTLKFMGEIEQERLGTLKESLSRSVQNQEKFHLEFRGIGSFPAMARPRVLWVGVEGNVNQLMKLADSVEKSVVESGFPENDKPFSAHLTVARFSFPPRFSYQESLEKYRNLSFGKLTVDQIYLVQSVLKPSGAEYEIVQEFPFVS